ncbi:MAG TPA: zinc-dependent metalloprotease [Saprospiraceae bacterium]|nr:zinc-dependent metalloprotease [Saprospiraceae bacterium]
MKQHLSILLLLFLQTAIFGQIHLTEDGRNIQGSDIISKDLSSGFVFQPNNAAFERLYHAEMFKERVILHLNEEEKITLLLEKRNLFSEDFLLRGMTREGRVELQADLGKHYRGTVQEVPGSWVAFSIYRDQVSALISMPKKGTFSLGQLKNPLQDGLSHIVYKDSQMRNAPTFHCHTGEEESKFLEPYNPQLKNSVEANCKAVRLYAEFDYYTYNNRFDANLDDANAYATFLLNMTVAMFEQDDIRLIVSEVFLWTVPDSYTRDNAGDALREFTDDYENDFNGDIGALIATVPNGNGGVAWLNVLCRQYNEGFSFGRTSYSNTSTWLRQIPAYSWDVNVLTHEIGHNLGSPHTHNCFWNGNNTKIDDCAGEFSEDFRDERCDPGALPNAGTIMSYCHLNVGVDFSLGFHPQPAELMRNRIASAHCLQAQSEVDTEISIEDVFGQPAPEKICLGDSLLLSVDEGYTYEWSNNQTSSSIFVNAPGVYRVTVFDANGCPREYRDTVTMNPLPEINYVISDTLFCPGDTAVIRVFKDSQQLISWNDTPGDSIFQLFDTDTLNLLVVDSITSCRNSDTVMVSFNPQPTLNYRTLDSAGLCTGDTTEITFNRLDSIYLEGSMATSDTSFSAIAGIYPMVGFMDGCETKDTLIIQEWLLPELTMRDSFYFCEGNRVILTPEEAEDSTILYRWNGSDTSYSLEVDRPGLYTLEAISAFGCRSEAQTAVFNVELPDSLSLGYSYTDGDSLYSVFLMTHLDSFSGNLRWHVPGLIVQEKNDSLSVFWGMAPPDTVNVCVQYITDEPIACQTDSFCIRVPTSLVLSAASPEADRFLKVYPNPFDEQLTVEWPSTGTLLSLELWNAEGKLSWQWDAAPLSGARVQLSTAHLPDGVYWLRAKTQQGMEIFPVLKMK